jgi:3-hydroxyisobutyrate dehydrogenase-like beta-hydroxyacid dehydrogenase
MTSPGSVRVAVLGLGEAGGRFATDLRDLGVPVRAYDPIAPNTPDGVERAETIAQAVAGADIVLTLVPASAVVAVATEAASALSAGAIYADCAACGVPAKLAAAEQVSQAGGRFADVALKGVVPSTGIRTPALLAGDGAAALQPLLVAMGMPVEVVSDRAGDAARRKLVRSVFMKGLAASVNEALEAARRLGIEDWLRAEIEAEIAGADRTMVERLERGTVRHARRRITEMEAALELLVEHGASTDVTRAALARLERLASADPDRG